MKVLLFALLPLAAILSLGAVGCEHEHHHHHDRDYHGYYDRDAYRHHWDRDDWRREHYGRFDPD